VKSYIYKWLRSQAEKGEDECRIVDISLLKKNPDAEVSDYALVGTWSPGGCSVGRDGQIHRWIFPMGTLKDLFEYYGIMIKKAKGQDIFPCLDF
jgi:hypothetical protein